MRVWDANFKQLLQVIDISDYNYDLPEDRVAKRPCSPRDHSKLLIYRGGRIAEDRFFNIASYLPSGSLMICNNTRVIHARIVFYQASGSRIEVFCLEPIVPSDYQQVFICEGSCVWKCFVGNAKKWKAEYIERVLATENGKILLRAIVEAKHENSYKVRFVWKNLDRDDYFLTFADILELFGEIPIPPYLNRKSDEKDRLAYQTVYSKIRGSVAAPTAGLHFTESTLEAIKERGVCIGELTLHVGAGTFQPVKVTDAAQHIMHREVFEIKKSVIELLLRYMGNVTAVGTTSVRALESLYFIGEYLETHPKEFVDCFEIAQFVPYNGGCRVDKKRALENILAYMTSFDLVCITAQTQIMIYPGYEFRYVDRLITNFHQPKSTLLLLVSAFVKGDWKSIYTYALDRDFRFLSYGDSSLLIP